MKGLAATVLLAAGSAGAEPYLELQGGTQWWSDQSNQDQIESGSEPGSMVALAVGDEAGLSDVGLPKSDFALDLEARLGWHHERLHGRNDEGEHRTADGRDLDLITVGVNLWPGWQLTRRLTLYAGGGGGAGYVEALGHTNWAPFAQLGAGARYNFTPELSLNLGYRTTWLDDVRFDGYRATYDWVHGLVAGARWEFKQ